MKVARQFSDAACREDETWGYDNSGIWVDKGCGAQFELLPYTPTTPTRIVCSSDDRRRKVCPADTRRGVRLVRQLSKAKCDQGRTWGYTRGASAGIWVDKGCRAEFEAGRPAQAAVSTAPSVSDRIVTCESNDGRYKHCSTGSIQQAWLKRKLSKAACVENQTWGYDESGVWVDGGCRAEFTVRPR